MNLRTSLKAFGPVWDGAGVRGFSGEGYWHHRLFPRDLFRGSTFVAKTTPVDFNKGNMALTASHTPRDLFPNCVDVQWWRGGALNAVGLSAPGFATLLANGAWQRIEDPFMFSHMPIRKGDAAQEDETREFVELMNERGRFHTRQLGVQFNRSCPSVGADLHHLIETTAAHLSILEKLGLPIIVKINLLVSPEAAKLIAMHPACAGLCVSNTIPFGTLENLIDWGRLYPHGSPLAKRGYPAGGLSGGDLIYLTADWIRRFRKIDDQTHVNGGLGVMRPEHVDLLHEAGANSIFFATVAMTRPWRVPSIIRRAHELNWK